MTKKKEEIRILQSELKERDGQIKSLEEELREIEETSRKVQEELDMMVAKQKEEKFLHEEKCEGLVKERVVVEKEMHTLQREMKESSTLHEYANLLRQASPGSVDSTYVVRLQAQLCKSMHSMGMLENQMTIVKKNCNGLVKSLKDEISSVTDDKCKMEVELINQLGTLDAEKKELEEEWQKKLDEKKAKTAELEEKVGPLESEEDEEDSDEDSEADEKKEQLSALKIQLAEMRTDKEVMEKELRKNLKEQREKLNAMKEENARQVERKKFLESGKREDDNGERSDVTDGTEDSDDPVR